jgi:type VII secretion protein EssB
VEEKVYRISNEDSSLKKGEREYLTAYNDFFADAIIAEEEDAFTLTVPANDYAPASGLKKADIADRYIFLISAYKLSRVAESYSFSLAPENLAYDVTFAPKVLLRGAPVATEESFTDRYRALLGELLGAANYEDYLKGGADLYAKDTELKEIALADTPEEVRDILVRKLEAKRKDTGRPRVKISKGRYRALITLLIAFVVLTLGCAGLTYKYASIDVPELNERIAISNAYASGDYPEVIDAVGEMGADNLSVEERYMAAYAGVKVSALESKQMDNILGSLKVTSDRMLLDYWVYMGLGDYEKGLDLSKRIGKSDLQIYALSVMLEDVKNDSSISGEDKEAKIKSIEDQLNTLSESINEAQQEDEQADETGNPVSEGETPAPGSAVELQ